MGLIRSPVLLFITLFGPLSCSRYSERPGLQATARPASDVSSVVDPAAQKLIEPTPEPITLLTTSGSAYAATLALDDEGTLRHRGTITAVAATAARLTWLMDIGRRRFGQQPPP